MDITTTIVAMNMAHIGGVTRVGEASFAIPWSRNSVKAELALPYARTLVALCGDDVLGFINARITFGEGYINNIAVLPAHRGASIGTQLLTAMVALAKSELVECLLLEVRISNSNAARFYEANGFFAIGTRKNFYEKPVEDAVIYKIIL